MFFKWKTDKSNFGRDPLGSRTMKSPVPSLSSEQVNRITNGLKVKSKKIITESLSNSVDNGENNEIKDDKNTILDEKNIKDIE